MANAAPPSTTIAALAPESDYGSDFDTDTEQQIAGFLAQTVAGAVKPYVLESIEQDAGNQELHPAAHVPKPSSQELRDLDTELEKYFEERQRRRETSVVVEYDEASRGAWSVAQKDHPLRSSSLDPNPSAINTNDKRSPLLRFRTKPKKPLSVTDLISPAWCELQYWFSLTKHGKKRQTPAMKQGSAVHKVLEEQVHSVVEVHVDTKEDMWGLKIWNVIQGLRTLRVTGMTRELEIWGVIDGQVVNGIIDELSYTAPREAVEGETVPEPVAEADSTTTTTGGMEPRLSINDYFRSQGAVVLDSDPAAWIDTSEQEQKTVYITDIKTRRAKTLPTGPALRPTFLQLQLYHRILTSLAAGAMDPAILFARYGVDATKPFTDSFIAQVGGLDYNFRDQMPQGEGQGGEEAEHVSPFESEADGVAELLANNSLTQLWKLMMAEYARAIPRQAVASTDNADTADTDADADAETQATGPPSISPLVKAEFRTPWDRRVIGSKVFRCDPAKLDAYIAHEMAWWKGEREAVGVEVEEAFKCGICEFAPECGWRRGKVEEGVEKVRLRKRGRPRKSEV